MASTVIAADLEYRTVSGVRKFVALADAGLLPMAVVERETVVEARRYLKFNFIQNCFFTFGFGVGPAVFVLSMIGKMNWPETFDSGHLTFSFIFMLFCFAVVAVWTAWRARFMPYPHRILSVLDTVEMLEYHMGSKLSTFADFNKNGISRVAIRRCRELAVKIVRKQHDYRMAHKHDENDYGEPDVSEEHRMLRERYNFFLGLGLVPAGGWDQFFQALK